MSSGAETGAPQRLPESPHIAVVANPASMRSDRLDRQLAVLKNRGYCTEQDILLTVPGGLDGNKNRLTELLAAKGKKQPYDALMTLGGDGTLNLTANFLLRTPGLTEKIRQTPVIAGNDGTANYGHRMTFGRIGRQRLRLGKLGKLSVGEITPLNIKTSSVNKDSAERLAVLHASLGFSALTVDRVNNPNHRANQMAGPTFRRRYHEFILGMYSLVDATDFNVQENDPQKYLFEIFISNLSRPDTQAADQGSAGQQPNFRITKLSSRPAVLAKMRKLLFKKTGRITDDEGYQSAKFTIGRGRNHAKHRAIPLQLDGESYWLANGTVVEIRPHSRTLKIVSTLLI